MSKKSVHAADRLVSLSVRIRRQTKLAAKLAAVNNDLTLAKLVEYAVDRMVADLTGAPVPEHVDVFMQFVQERTEG